MNKEIHAQIDRQKLRLRYIQIEEEKTVRKIDRQKDGQINRQIDK